MAYLVKARGDGIFEDYGIYPDIEIAKTVAYETFDGGEGDYDKVVIINSRTGRRVFNISRTKKCLLDTLVFTLCIAFCAYLLAMCAIIRNDEGHPYHYHSAVLGPSWVGSSQ